MPNAIELPESDVAVILETDDGLVVHFRQASVHQWSDAEGQDGSRFFPAPAEIVFSHATYSGTLASCHGRLADGFLRFDERSSSTVPIPLDARRGVWAQFVFDTGAVLTIVAARARGTLINRARRPVAVRAERR